MTHDNTVPIGDEDDSPVDSPATMEASAASSDISTREAVRRCLAELGADADIDDVLAHLQSKYNLTPPRGTVQSYGSLARKDARDGLLTDPRRRGRPRKVVANGGTAAPPIDEVIAAVEILRDLCDRLGDDNVRRLLEAL